MHCFNLVIEVLFVSSCPLQNPDTFISCRFNLVIEVLFVSSSGFFLRAAMERSFNLVIEVLFVSSGLGDPRGITFDGTVSIS